MNGFQAGKFAFILAENARVAGMTAENMQRQVLGQSMAFDAAAFWDAAHRIDSLAIELLNAS